MKRRTYLTVTGSVGAGLTIATPVASAGRDGALPAEQVPAGDVSPFDWNEPQSVSTGEWITHGFGWISTLDHFDDDEYDHPCDNLAWIVDENTDYRVELPDRTFDFGESEAYWSECQETTHEGYDAYERMWEFSTPPKPPGEYEFSITIRYHEPQESCDVHGNCEIIPPGDHHFSATYTVEAGNDRGNR